MSLLDNILNFFDSKKPSPKEPSAQNPKAPKANNPVDDVALLNEEMNNIINKIKEEYNVIPDDKINRIDPYIIAPALEEDEGKVNIVLASNSNKYKELIGKGSGAFEIKYLTFPEFMSLVKQTRDHAKQQQAQQMPLPDMFNKSLIDDYTSSIPALKDVLIENLATYLIKEKLKDYKELSNEQLITGLLSISKENFEDRLEEYTNFENSNSKDE